MIDDDSVKAKKQQRIEVIYKFLDQLFSNRKITSEYCWEVISPQPEIDWEYFESVLTHEQLCSFRAVSRIAYYLPQEPFYEFQDCLEWDINGHCVQNENDLIEYGKYGVSSATTLIAFVLCHKSNQWPDRMGPMSRFMIENVRKMGTVRIILKYQIDNNPKNTLTDNCILRLSKSSIKAVILFPIVNY